MAKRITTLSFFVEGGVGDDDAEGGEDEVGGAEAAVDGVDGAEWRCMNFMFSVAPVRERVLEVPKEGDNDARDEGFGFFMLFFVFFAGL